MDSDNAVALISCDNPCPVYLMKEDLDKSVTLSHLRDHVFVDKMEIPIPNVSHQTLQKIAHWLKNHRDVDLKDELKIEEGQPTPELPEWNKNFFNELDKEQLLSVIQAAEYLQIEELMDMGCRVVAAKLRKAASVQAIRNEWGIKPEWTTEEERKVKRDLRWCYK